MPGGVGAGLQLHEQPRLAESRLAADPEQPGAAVAEPLQRRVELGQLPFAPDERPRLNALPLLVHARIAAQRALPARIRESPDGAARPDGEDRSR